MRLQVKTLHQEVNQGRIRATEIISDERKRDAFGILGKALVKQYIPEPSGTSVDKEIRTCRRG